MKRLLPLAFSILAILFFSPVLKAQQWVNYNSYNTANGLSHNTVYDIAIDNAGNKWFACYYGISVFNGSAWTKYTTANTSGGLAGDRVYCIAIDNAGNKWFGTNGGVSKLSGNTWTKYTTADGLANDEVHVIAIDGSGNLWFGTDGGLTKFTGSDWTNYKAVNGLVSNYVQAIAVEGSTVWLGCYGGVSKFNGTGFTNYVHSSDGLKGFSVNAIAIDPGGKKIFATDSGISFLDGTTWSSYTTSNGLPSNDVRALALDAGGKLWIGTSNGAGVLSGGVLRVYRTSDGLASDEINTIETSVTGDVWFGLGMNGVSKLSPPALSVSETSVSIAPADGSHGYFSIYSNAKWTLSTSQAWLTPNITTATGNSSITLTATANPLSVPRVASLIIQVSGLSPVTVTVTQQAAPAFLTVSPESVSLPSAAGSMAFAAIETNLSWTASSDQSWCTVTPSSGSSTTVVTLSVQANGSASSRSATVTVSAPGVPSKTISITQESAGAPSLSVSPSSVSLSSAASSNASVSVSSTVTWTASSDQGWLTVGTPSGTGNATVILTASENSGNTARVAIVTFSGSGVPSRTVTVTQARSPYIDVSATSLAIDPAHNALFSTQDFTVNSNTHWEISWSGGWFNLSRNQGDGNAGVTVTAEPNTSASERTGYIYFRLGNSSSPVVHTITITQAAGPYLTVTPVTVNIGGAAGSQGTFTISTNTSWNLAFTNGGMTADITSGTGDATVTVTAPENNTGAIRRELVTVLASTTQGLFRQTEISQASIAALLDITPASLEIANAANATATFSIASNRDWAISIDQIWLNSNVTSGSGNATITLSANENPFDTPQTATVTITGDGGNLVRKITVNQPASVFILEASVSTINIPADDNYQATFTLTSNIEWGISSNSNWLTVSPATSSGTKTVTITAAGNYTGEQRTARLTVWTPTVAYNRYIDVVQSITTNVDVPAEDKVTLYPNPASDFINILSPEDNISVTVCDPGGRKILETDLSGTVKRLNISALGRGAYVLRIDSDTRSEVLRFIKR